MRTQTSESGFSLVEVLTATAISLVVIGTAMMAFKDGIAMNETATNLADASQNLRSGTNFLVRDLMQTGKGIPTGGISIPSGTVHGQILRPSPPGTTALPLPQLYIDNNFPTTSLPAVISGQGKGPLVDGQTTDMITLLTIDPILDACLTNPLALPPVTTPGSVPKMSLLGDSFSIGATTLVACIGTGATGNWLVGDATQGQSPIKKGDLILFTDPGGKTALQAVTSTDTLNVYFASNILDEFGINQRNATAGSITNILGQSLTAQRVLMYTYYVDTTEVGAPHLMRRLNMFAPQALAGVVEDLEFTYDLVDGLGVNPVDVRDLPYTLGTTVYSANQIRKVRIHVGVRSEAKATRQNDYLRNHLSTVVSLRSLAFVDRYK